MPRYICIPCSTPRGEDAERLLFASAMVDADTHEEAAAEAHEVIVRESSEEPDPNFLDTMFVLEIDAEAFVALNKTPTYVRAAPEWQCCGGPCPFTNDGHFAGCPNHHDEEVQAA